MRRRNRPHFLTTTTNNYNHNYPFLTRIYNSFSLFTSFLPSLSLKTSLLTLRTFFSRALNMLSFFSDFPGDYSGDVSGVIPRRDDEITSYLVPFRWWSEAWKALFADSSEMNGVYYSADSRSGEFDFVTDIVLKLSKRDGCGISSGQEGDCALVAEGMFLRAAKWHNDVKEVGHCFSTEDNMPDMFPLMIKLSVSLGSSSLTARIHKQDNRAASFSIACSIFHVESGVLGIWDFSGQTTSREEIEIPLEVQVCGSPNLWGRRTDNMEAEQSSSGGFCSSLMANETTDHSISSFSFDKSAPFGSCHLKIGNMGLTGLQNLGNTCYMNSVIQCLVHTPDIVDYFLGGYRKDINTENPNGTKGELALSFGNLLTKLWVPGATPVAPKAFKSIVAAFAPQFCGYKQHDSPDFLTFMLTKLHEDLNGVKFKPQIEPKEIGGCPDEEVADEYSLNHLSQDGSIIADLCKGQCQSTLECSVCKEVSIASSDTFWYLAVSLPQTTMRVMTLTVFSTDGTSLPCPVTVTVPKYGHATDLLQALSTACCLKDDETLLIAEIFDCRILQFMDDPTGSLELLRDDDKLVAYKLPKKRSCLVVFMHESLQSLHNEDYLRTQSKRFGTPLIACISNLSAGSEILEAFSRVLSPFSMPVEKDEDDVYDELNSDKETDREDNMSNTDRDLSFDDSNSGPGFQFFFTEGSNLKGQKIKMNEPLPVPPLTEMFNLTVTWPEKMETLYNTCLLSNLHQICELQELQEQLSLYKCLEAFLEKELLINDNMWSCPKCKEKQQASKKLDISRLPKILIIQLKKFESSHGKMNKLETFVDFPVDDLDLSSYVLHKNSQVSQRYKLYAVINHFGNFGGGHYTAFARLGAGGWYEFNDIRVSPVIENQIKTSAAYLLFYRRKEASDL